MDFSLKDWCESSEIHKYSILNNPIQVNILSLFSQNMSFVFFFRGLMKRRFPSPNNETLTANLKYAVKKYLYGINYSAKKNEHQQDFGLIETVIGTVSTV